MEAVRRFLSSTAGRICAVVFSLAVLVTAIYEVQGYLHSETPDSAFYTTFICTETGKSFKHRNELGESLPILSPFSGKNTGMPAEACYWNADGTTRTEPTWVLLNEEKGQSGPTFCPDCGRLVVGRNPQPGPGVKPPPTKEEYGRYNSHAAHSAGS